jgi:hypothetical protein
MTERQRRGGDKLHLPKVSNSVATGHSCIRKRNIHKTTKFRDFSPRADYTDQPTDRLTAASQRS